MIWPYVLSAVTVIVIGFSMIRFKARLKLVNEELFVDIAFGKITKRVYPAVKKDKIKKQKKKEKPPQKKEEAKPEKSGGDEMVMFSVFRDNLSRIVEEVKRLFSSLRMDRLMFGVRIAGDDAARTAILYGAANSLAGLLISMLERVFTIKKREIMIEADFIAEKTTIRLDAVITIAVWQVIAAAVRMAALTLKLMLKARKAGKKNAETI